MVLGWASLSDNPATSFWETEVWAPGPAEAAASLRPQSSENRRACDAARLEVIYPRGPPSSSPVMDFVCMCFCHIRATEEQILF